LKVIGAAAILAGFGGVAIGLAAYAVCNKNPFFTPVPPLVLPARDWSGKYVSDLDVLGSNGAKLPLASWLLTMWFWLLIYLVLHC
jgi:hypothetical protein